MENDNMEMTKSYDKEILKRLLTYAKPYTLGILFSFILLIGVIGVELYRPVLVGSAIDEVINDYNQVYSVVSSESEDTIEIRGMYLLLDDNGTHSIEYTDNAYYLMADGEEGILLSTDELKLLRENDINRLVRIVVIFIGILIAGFLLHYFQTIVLHYTGQKIIYNIRNEVFSHIQSLSIQFFNNNPVGKLVTRVTNDTETLNEMYTSVIVNSAKSILLLVGISIMMLILDWQLTLTVFIVIPLVVLATVLFRKHSRKAYKEVRTKVSAINTFLSEHISGMKIVQIFAQEDRMMEEFDKENAELRDANLRQLIIFSFFRPSMYFFYVVGLSIVLGVGGMKVYNGTMSIGILVIFIQYISSFFDPIQELAEQFNILQSAMASSEKIFSLLDEKDQISKIDEGVVIDHVIGEIEFKNVWFAYNEEDWVLKDVSFKVNPGETIAFVGATGAGKTSILNLISRYYDIQKGEILVDGVNIKEIQLGSLRSHIGQMLQDVFLFTGDISSNVRLKNEQITEGQIKEASTYVNADKFISRLPGKYNEKVTERGATFSAGQRQLLSFARTLAFAPNILILDEATSNIDTETEILIQEALIKLMEGRTTLVVAHRLSTIQHADKIIVMHKGTLREMGNHQELLAKKGLYYNLYQLQYQDV